CRVVASEGGRTGSVRPPSGAPSVTPPRQRLPHGTRPTTTNSFFRVSVLPCRQFLPRPRTVRLRRDTRWGGADAPPLLGPPHRPPRLGPGVLPVTDHLHPIHEHLRHPGGVLVRL